MRFTAQEEYGLRCMLQLAKNEDNGPLSIEDIARNEGLTAHYVGKLMRILLKGKLVTSTRGQNGGYTLVRPAVRISAEEVIHVLDGRLFENKYCSKYTGQIDHCVHTSECSVRSLWSTLDGIVSSVLKETTLRDLTGDNSNSNGSGDTEKKIETTI
ncbi:MAG: Rrf2 family transcriptional regulator [bacterium]|nr:Rrf2 family transcriptional regulator [bacterium]